MPPEQSLDPDVAAVIELGINHEQQHQELILTDIKHALGAKPAAARLSRRRGASPSNAHRAPWSGRSIPAGSNGSGTTAAGSRSTTKARATAFTWSPTSLARGW